MIHPKPAQVNPQPRRRYRFRHQRRLRGHSRTGRCSYCGRNPGSVLRRLEARMGAMQRPTSAAGPQPGSGDFALDPAKNFEDLGDKAMLDPATREMLAQLADFNPEDFQKQ